MHVFLRCRLATRAQTRDSREGFNERRAFVALDVSTQRTAHHDGAPARFRTFRLMRSRRTDNLFFADWTTSGVVSASIGGVIVDRITINGSWTFNPDGSVSETEQQTLANGVPGLLLHFKD